MKYIRTKDEIYEREQTLPTGTIFNADCLYTDNELIYDVQTGFGIIAQADTIEELCDEFIGIDNSDYHFHFTELEKINGNYSYLNEEYKVFYGAIWTDKGLQFVARMNNEGILELL